MLESKFKIVLQKEEEIKWVNDCYVKAAVLRNTGAAVFFTAFLSIWLSGFFTIFFAFGSNGLSAPNPFLGAIVIFPIGIILYFAYSYLTAKNTYFCITNKRIIKRSGAFNNRFIHYTLKNIGTVEVVGGIFDNSESANLIVTTKDFHNDQNGYKRAIRLKISSLNKAYEAYNILYDSSEGNNEVTRIKIEK